MRKLITLLALAFCLNGRAQIINTVAGDGAAGYFGDGAAATAAVLYNPRALTFDAAGKHVHC